MSHRKTIAVDLVRKLANQKLASDIPEEQRHGICWLLEAILFETENYAGYNGVDWLEGGSERYQEQQALTPRQLLNPCGLDMSVPKEYLGPEYKRRYY